MNDVRFQCQHGCVRCCESKGVVYLTEQDSTRIAAYLNKSLPDFESKYVYRTAHLRRLRTPRGSPCPFLGNGGCTIHDVKPVQCRLFPFWPEYIENAIEWARLRTWCPGIGKGELIQITSVNQIAQEMREAFPAMYRQRSNCPVTPAVRIGPGCSKSETLPSGPP